MLIELFTLLVCVIATVLFLLRRGDGTVNGRSVVTVVVLGDIGRSPRMQYHAISLAEQAKCSVKVVGYGGTECWPSVTQNANIELRELAPIALPRWLARSLVMRAALKVPLQISQLFYVLLTCKKPKAFFIQNPPAVPTLPVVILVAFLRGVKVVIDWHNYGYTVLAVRRKSTTHPIVKAYEKLEMLFGSMADGHFCVSKAMKDDLKERLNVTAHVLYDIAPSMFKRCNDDERRTLLSKYEFGKKVLGGNGDIALVVSGTSWTPDERFEVFIDGVKRYDVFDNPKKLCIVITGKADNEEDKARHMRVITNHKWKNVFWYTDFLPYQDYCQLIGSADLGVCLHASSSKLDLPMKVVDMYGAGLPCLALDYKCISELVKPNVFGLLFSDEEDLAIKLKDTFENDRIIGEWRNALLDDRKGNNWRKNWEDNALPIFSKFT